MTKARLEKLWKLAVASRKNSYSPYSEKKVGAAIALAGAKGGDFGGCNIENVSFGGTVCAERVAIWKALSENPGARITDVVVVTDEKIPWSPCGFCRQVIAEFSSPGLKIHLADLKGIRKTFDFQTELFPEGFTPQDF